MFRIRFAVAVMCVAVITCAPVRGDEEVKPAPKTFTFQMKDAKWDDVFDWYAKESSRKADVRVKPTGTFTTPGQNSEFTIGEITDLLNEALVKQKLVLIPHRKTFAVVSNEGKIDPKLIPVVELNELSQFGRTAIVEAAIPLVFEVDDQTIGTLKKLVPDPEIVRAKGKSIVVRATMEEVLFLTFALRPL